MTVREMIFSKDPEMINLGIEFLKQDHIDEECKDILNELYEEYLMSDDHNQNLVLENTIYKIADILPEDDVDTLNFKNNIDPWHRREEKELELEEQEDLFE